MASLKEHKISETSTFNCPGYLMVGGNRFRCWAAAQGHGRQSLVQALTHSCDVYFYLAGLGAGVDAISAMARQFGLSARSGIDWPGEKAGLVPSREWKQKTLHAPWYEGDTANFSIGQGYLQLTPLQALIMIASVATDGQRLRPHVIDKIDGVKVAQRHAVPMDIQKEDLAAVKRGLDQVINSDTGTGRLARLEGLRLAGKTGSAEAGRDKKTHAWFVGFAPEEDPKAAIVVFLEHGGHGGLEGASLANKIFRWLKENGYL